MKLSREIKIGLVFIIAIALLIWGLNYLKGNNPFSKQRTFYAIYERVDGLVAANPVNLNGLKIGQVNSLAFTNDGSANIVVKFVIKNDILIPVNSSARIYSEDIMGSKAINLILGDSEAYCMDGDTLISDIEAGLMAEVNKQVQPIKIKAENLIASIDSMVTIVRYVFNEEMRDNLSASVESIKNTISNLERTTQKIDTIVMSEASSIDLIVSNIESVTATLKDNNDNINNILSNLSAVSDTLAGADLSKTLEATNQTLKDFSELLRKIEQGEGNLGLLLKDDSLYYSLLNTTNELNALLEDLKLNPDRYIHVSVFGKNASKNPYVSPEEAATEEENNSKKKKKRNN